MDGFHKVILGGRIFTPERVIDHGYLVIEGERIIAVEQETGELPVGWHVVDASSYWVTPGLIDLHLHGAMGHNAMGPGLAQLSAELPRHGVTSFLPTTLTGGASRTHAAISQMAASIPHASNGARRLGIHLEGPHLSPEKPGMAPPGHIRALTWEALADLQHSAGGSIRMVTFAPEEGDGMCLIPRMLQEGIVPSIGHSVATFEQVSEMVGLGLRHASHVFNGMGPFHHRAPGVVGAVLYHREIVAQLIADRHHVHPAAMELLFRLKGVGHVASVSDAAPVAGLPPGAYDWNDDTRVIVHPDGACRLLDGTLAGGISFLDENVANLVKAVGLSWSDALGTATWVPAKVLDVQRGRLRPGWMADVAVWDEGLRPVATMIEGRWVWRGESLLEDSE